jgi:hypothetical protein
VQSSYYFDLSGINTNLFFGVAGKTLFISKINPRLPSGYPLQSFTPQGFM